MKIIWLLLGVLLASGCILAKPSPPAQSFTFTPGQGNCATGEPDVAFWSEGGALRFEGSVISSTPCYTLEATHSISGKIIEISIHRKPLGGICIQCIGALPFQGEITGLMEGDYEVKVLLDGKPLKEAEVTIK